MANPAMKQVVFQASPDISTHLSFDWRSEFRATPQEAVDSYFERLNTESSNRTLETKRLRALNLRCGRCTLEVSAWFVVDKDSYRQSNFGPRYCLGSHLAQSGLYLPGPGTIHWMIDGRVIDEQTDFAATKKQIDLLFGGKL